MNPKNIGIVVSLALIILLFSACQMTSSQEVEYLMEIPDFEEEYDVDDIPLEPVEFIVVVEGHLVPKEFADLSFVTGGRVEEIFFAKGDEVEAGDVIARLGNREPIESSLAAAREELSAAQFDLLAAQQDLQNLYDNWPQDATAAQEALTDIRQEVHDTERTYFYRTTPSDQTDIDVAWAQVLLAEDKLEKAREDFEKYEHKAKDDLTRARLQSMLAEKQGEYDDAVRKHNALANPSNEFEISQAEADFRIAQGRLEQAQEDYDKLLNGPDPDDLALAEARIASVEARIASAQTDIESAQSALDDLDLVAIFSGSIVELDLILGQQVTPGQSAVKLVDFSQWYVETNNLTEFQVVNVFIGQDVSVILDAEPSTEFPGYVASIDDFYEENDGKITYTAQILLDEGEYDPIMRWGMTVTVIFVE